ncbi:MAG TPA: hypothetical protein VLF68_02900 [Candidatus Saccharimonadales bacterium]|nr:hypothetical protein [Candidatus Saccharimonadales bacterium]
MTTPENPQSMEQRPPFKERLVDMCNWYNELHQKIPHGRGDKAVRQWAAELQRSYDQIVTVTAEEILNYTSEKRADVMYEAAEVLYPTKTPHNKESSARFREKVLLKAIEIVEARTGTGGRPRPS